MSVLVVGSVALDSVETPFGRVTEVLGGSAVYFSVAASRFTNVRLVAVVGKDFPDEHIQLLRERGVDLTGLQIADGRTFRWVGSYDYDLNVTHTHDTQLNVFGDFHPVLPDSYRDSRLLFLANIHPDLQYEVLRQIPRAELTMMDTMNFWIEGARESLLRVMREVDIVTMNEAEARMLTGKSNLVVAAGEILKLGPKILLVKKGEYGAVMFSEHGYFVAPAYPLEEVIDPTGAGDSFAGGFLGYLARAGTIDGPTLRRAVIYGSVVASFAVAHFSVGRLKTMTEADIRQRYEEFRQFTLFEPAEARATSNE